MMTTTAPIDTQESPLAHLDADSSSELGAGVRRDQGPRRRRARRPRPPLHRGDDRDAAPARRDRPRRPPAASRSARSPGRRRRGALAAKILENMEIGHNVMHGQWDWMNDPADPLLDLGLGHRLDRRGLEALPQLRPPHLHQHPRQGQGPRLRDHADRPAAALAPGLPGAAALQPGAGGALRVGRGAARPRLRGDPDRRKSMRQVQARAQGDRRQGPRPGRQGLHRLAAGQRALAAGAAAAPASRRSPPRAEARGTRTLVLGRRRGRLAPRPRASRRPDRRPRPRRRRPGLPPRRDRRRHRQHRPQRLVLRDHLLRPLPRPDLHLQRRRKSPTRPAAAGTSAS